MTQYQCPRFHLYHAAEGDDRGCPVCAAQQSELARTRGVWLEPAAVAPGSDKKTVGAYAHLDVAVDPVVGWLACISGPDKGRDWRLVAGRNGIGRGEGLPVRLAADARVTREAQAVISFDPRRGGFMLAPGEGTGLVYRNGQELLVPEALEAHDRIELGASTLVFVPLVGPRFAWGT